MPKNTNLDGMSKEDLLALKEEIDHRLKDASFWETIEALYSIDNQRRKLGQKREKIGRSCIQLKKLYDLQYSLVIYSSTQKRVGFINYDIPQVDDKYYGFDVTEEGLSSESSYQPLSDADRATVSRILGLEVLKS